MLTYYQTQTTQLLANPGAPTPLYATTDITTWINTARTQLAGETGCIRLIGTLPITASSQTYPFSSITTSVTGAQNVYAVRQTTITSGTGQVYLGSRGYPWATLYWLNNSAPVAAQPTEWAQYGQGATGSLIFNTTPNASYTVNCDCTWEPIPLVSDSTTELIPYPFQDAVCYFAAYLAYMSSQRQGDADRMYGRYQEFVNRSRKISIPNVLGFQYDMSQPSPTVAPQGPQQGGGR